MPDDTESNTRVDRKGFLRTGVAGAVVAGGGLTVSEGSARLGQ